MNADLEAFSAEQMSRELGFYTEKTMSAFSSVLIGIAGNGAVGSTAAVAFLKGGFQVKLADPDIVEPPNIYRQYYTYDQIGQNKAEALRDNLLAINPFINLDAYPDGVTPENMNEFMKGVSIIFDAIDLRELDTIHRVHEYAAKNGIPVIMGLDLAGTAMLVNYRYDLRENSKPMNGAYSAEDIENFVKMKQKAADKTITEAEFITYIYGLMPELIEMRKIPYEQLYEALTRSDVDNTIYQSPHTPLLLSALAVEVARKISLGEAVKTVISVDIPTEVRPFGENIITFFKKVGLIGKVLLKYNI